MKKYIGITGGSGTGKGVVAEAFRMHGCCVIDADRVAREVVEPKKPALLEIKEAFGSGVLLPDGTLNRRALSDIVFSSPEKLHILNQITHKYIKEEILKEAQAAKESIVVIDAPLLIESGLCDVCDKIVFVSAEKETRILRIVLRDGLTRERAVARIEAQKDDSFYLNYADFHIRNDASEDAAKAKAIEILKEIVSE